MADARLPPELIKCAWCDREDTQDNTCTVCGGCLFCCSEDDHCAYCQRPFGVCTCQMRNGPINDPEKKRQFEKN
jgi:hypothetical protein